MFPHATYHYKTHAAMLLLQELRRDSVRSNQTNYKKIFYLVVKMSCFRLTRKGQLLTDV